MERQLLSSLGGRPLSTSTVPGTVGLSGHCCPVAGCKQSSLINSWWEKSDQLLGQCPHQLASGDMKEKALSHHSWKIRQASLGSPHSLSALFLLLWPCLIPDSFAACQGICTEGTILTAASCSVCIFAFLHLLRPQIAQLCPENQCLNEPWSCAQSLPHIVPVCL